MFLSYKFPLETFSAKNYRILGDKLKKRKISMPSRIVQILCAIACLLIFSPLLIISSIAILIEDGIPFLFIQKRTGLNGSLFNIYKLRTIKNNSKKILFTGKFLRHFHIDELPQLINIIKGEMSFIGPRPEQHNIVLELQKKIPFYSIRHLVKPGITGWSQVHYIHEDSEYKSREKFSYDLYYLYNKNLFLDLKILLKTIKRLFSLKR